MRLFNVSLRRLVADEFGAVAAMFVIFVASGFFSVVLMLNAVAAYVMTEKAAENAAREVAYQLAQSNIWTTQLSRTELEAAVRDTVLASFSAANGSSLGRVERYDVDLDGRRVTLTINASVPVWGMDGFRMNLRASARSPIRTVDTSLAFSIAGETQDPKSMTEGAPPLAGLVSEVVGELRQREIQSFSASFAFALIGRANANITRPPSSLRLSVVPFNHQVAHSVGNTTRCDDARGGKLLTDTDKPAKTAVRNFVCDSMQTTTPLRPSRRLEARSIEDASVLDYVKSDLAGTGSRLGHGGCRDLAYGLSRAYQELDKPAGTSAERVIVLISDGPSTFGRNSGLTNNPDGSAVRDQDCNAPGVRLAPGQLKTELVNACAGAKRLKQNGMPEVRLVFIDVAPPGGARTFPQECDAFVLSLGTRSGLSNKQKAARIVDAVLGSQ